MQTDSTADNRYAVGAIMAAVDKPNQHLIIKSYNQRIYYCVALPEPTEGIVDQVAYFDHELLIPAATANHTL